MSELEPTDSRVVHGNAAPEKGDERFAQQPEQAEQPGDAPDTGTREDGLQQEQSRDNDAQFKASDLDRGAAQYQREPLIRQQHQSDDWSDHNDRGESQEPLQDDGFETGQADYGSAQRKAADNDDDG